jgi:hypothetical protein
VLTGELLARAAEAQARTLKKTLYILVGVGFEDGLSCWSARCWRRLLVCISYAAYTRTLTETVVMIKNYAGIERDAYIIIQISQNT